MEMMMMTPPMVGCLFLHLALKTEIANLFTDLHPLQSPDDSLSEHQGDQQRDCESEPGPEGDVSQQVFSGEIPPGTELFV